MAGQGSYLALATAIRLQLFASTRSQVLPLIKKNAARIFFNTVAGARAPFYIRNCSLLKSAFMRCQKNHLSTTVLFFQASHIYSSLEIPKRSISLVINPQEVMMNSSKFALQQGQTVLVAGSRFPFRGHLPLIERIADRMQEIGASLICGDAKGIDTLIAVACARRNVPIHVYGIGRQPRREFQQALAGHHYKYTPVHTPSNIALRKKFEVRDFRMNDHADFRIFLWNGQNKNGGTFQGWAYSVRNKYPAVLYNRNKRIDNGF